jgi:hypothetical protein
MGYTRRLFSGTGLTSIGVPRKDWPHLGLTTTVDSGPAVAVGRTLELRLTEADVNWIISVLAADERFGGRMAEVLAYKAGLLAAATGAESTVQQRISASGHQLASALHKYVEEISSVRSNANSGLD